MAGEETMETMFMGNGWPVVAGFILGVALVLALLTYASSRYSRDGVVLFSALTTGLLALAVYLFFKGFLWP